MKWQGSLVFSVLAEQDSSMLLQSKTAVNHQHTSEGGFALETLGPFPLAPADVEFSKVNLKKGKWSAEGMGKSGKLATSMGMDCSGTDYWLGASSVAWAYPRKTPTSSNDVRVFENYGGFILVDDDGEVMQSLEISRGNTDPLMTMHFDEPFGITEDEWSGCVNPSKITIQTLWDAGAREYCWETNHHECERGCFLYKTTKGFQGFAVKDFALQTIGPFPLVTRPDLVSIPDDSPTGSTYSAHQVTGKLGSDFWLGAHSVQWIYNNGDAGIRDAASGNFEKYGGFALRGTDENEVRVLEIDVTATAPDMTLQFSKPFHVSADTWQSCEGTAPITIASLSMAGAEEYCWLVDNSKCVQGCFLYKTTSGFQGFAVKPYSMESLGPFVLHKRSDLAQHQKKGADAIIVNGQKHDLSASATWHLCPDNVPIPGTVGMARPIACDAQWAYQATHVTVASDAPGSFEKYGAFLINDELWEISEGVGPTLSFGAPFHVTKADFELSCKNSGRITLGGLDAQNYCWASDAQRCTLGCFYYKTADGYQAFPAKRLQR